jgi:hypothetical protein
VSISRAKIPENSPLTVDKVPWKEYVRVMNHHQANPKSAEQLLHVGDSALPPDMAAAELAAWTSVTRVILNLHETVTRS